MAGIQQHTGNGPYVSRGNGTGEPVGQAEQVSLGRGKVENETSRDGDDFAAYLNRTSITIEEKAKSPHKRDAADLIMQNSVYGNPAPSLP